MSLSRMGIASGDLPLLERTGTAIVLPLDAAAVTWQAAGGIRALTGTWLNGNLFDVVVASTTTTIKAINGYPDLVTLAAALGTSVGYVSKVYDQSGLGNDFTQGTANNRPAIYMIGGRPVILFDGYTQLQFSSVPKYLTMPSGVALNNRSGTYFFACKQANSSPADSVNGALYNAFLSTAATGLNGATLYQGPNGGSGANVYKVIDSGNFAVGSSTLFPETQPMVVGWALTSTNWTVTQNETSQTVSSPMTAGTTTGGQLGAWTANAGGTSGGFYGQMFGWALSSSILTTPQQAAVRNSFYSLFGINKAPTTSILFDGASVTEGFGAIPDPATDGVWGAGYGFVDQTLTALGTPIRAGNTGIGGATLANLNSNYAGGGHAFFSAAPAGRKILVAGGFAAHNSFAAGRTAAQAFSDLQTYITTAKADAWDTVFVFTDYEGGTNQAAAVTYNASVIANAASMGVTVINIGQSGPLTTNWGGSTPYYNDVSNVHPSLFGHGVIVTPTLAALRAIGIT